MNVQEQQPTQKRLSKELGDVAHGECFHFSDKPGNVLYMKVTPQNYISLSTGFMWPLDKHQLKMLVFPVKATARWIPLWEK